MASQVAIGRFGSDGYGNPLGGPGGDVTVTQWVRDGNRVSCGGWIIASTSVQSNWNAVTYQRDRLLAYANNPDEPVVPVCWTSDTTQNGYYRVLGVSSPWDLATSIDDRTVPAFRWSAELELVAHNPVLEMVSVGAVRTNAHGIAAGDVRAFHCVPDEALGYSPGAASLGVNTIAYPTDGLLLRRYDDGTPVSPHFFDARQHWFLSPTVYYGGGCTILTGTAGVVDWAEAPAYTVAGRTTKIDPALWTIGSGLVQVSPGGTGVLTFEWWDPTAEVWYDKDFKLGGDDTDFGTDASAVTVVRNHPDICTVRLTINSQAVTSVTDSVTADVTVRRGSRVVELYIRNESSITAKWQVRLATNEANSSMTGGRYATSNDADGNRYVLLCPVAFTDVTTGDGIALNAAATSGTFGIGEEVDGTSATDPWLYTDLRDEFYAVLGQRSWISRA